MIVSGNINGDNNNKTIPSNINLLSITTAKIAIPKIIPSQHPLENVSRSAIPFIPSKQSKNNFLT
jgi:hypothetical protein